MSALRIIVRTIGGLLIALANLMPLFVGGRSLWVWVHLQFGDPFYVFGGYLGHGLSFVIPSALSFGLALYVLLARRARVGSLILAFIVGFLIIPAITLPNLLGGPASLVVVCRAGVESEVGRASQALFAWAHKTGRFPANEGELGAAVQEVIGQKDYLNLSYYKRAGQRIPYRLVYVASATGPHLPEPPGDAPAIIYCAVSHDLKHFWLTATVLEGEFGRKVVFLTTADSGLRQALLEEGEL